MAVAKVAAVRTAEVLAVGLSGDETQMEMAAVGSEEVMLVAAGQGTLGVEIMDQMPNIDYLFIAVGGGGLIAGVAAYIKNVKPEVVIVGCQPAASPVMYQVWRLSCAKYRLIIESNQFRVCWQDT